jgi:general secretion pathway protein D
VVVRDAQAGDLLSMDRYDLMRSGLQDAQPVHSDLVPINESPRLPALPGTVPAVAPQARPAAAVFNSSPH